MLLPAGGVGMTSTMDDINLIQQAQRHHLVVRELGEEIDLEIGPGDDDPSFPHNSLLGVQPHESSAKEHAENKLMMVLNFLMRIMICQRHKQGNGRRRLLKDGERNGLIHISGHMLMSRMGQPGYSVLCAESMAGSIDGTHMEMKAVGICR
ncbi:UNVERIFIED_CONTAM: hypothetical protein Sangu_2091000 [Sesamum angustifolium]|uniref:Uncharacterized protein n=1 Tax=Sesamum angustifolium TaxID=2727405 RepID=A0AAW2LKT0_9LAMI